MNVKLARQEKGWSQEELAHQAELHRTYISGVERGVRNPTVTVLEKIAIALGLGPGRLLD
ncbi:MAG: helix-turn-helix transcriptional regulator [Phenylobacterium sp.]|uniref:helix-turn-helix domain-containing protein n=1 Tax=Phenylobacterium sp. TaxID=1871053 RepID=UPI002736EEB9|nr:helix-turn-helix transcriptional regulator [Phenylobacterium sp.]MDP3174802.1 helix-turn-helix transcriptional regulator [Phenylobacterium sp.]